MGSTFDANGKLVADACCIEMRIYCVVLLSYCINKINQDS